MKRSIKETNNETSTDQEDKVLTGWARSAKNWAVWAENFWRVGLFIETT